MHPIPEKPGFPLVWLLPGRVPRPCWEHLSFPTPAGKVGDLTPRIQTQAARDVLEVSSGRGRDLPSPVLPALLLHAFSNWIFFPQDPGDLSWWKVKPGLFGKGRRGPGWMNGSSKETLGSEKPGEKKFPAGSSCPCPWKAANTHLAGSKGSSG